MSDFTPTQVSSPQIQTAVAVGATMDKKYEGEVIGRSATLFTSAFNESTALGTYLAMESFDGTLSAGQAPSTSRTPKPLRARARRTSSSSSFRAAERAGRYPQ